MNTEPTRPWSRRRSSRLYTRDEGVRCANPMCFDVGISPMLGSFVGGFSPAQIPGLVSWGRGDAPLYGIGAITATGTSPPAVLVENGVLITTPLTSWELDITSTGPRGTAQFQWKLNGVVQQTGLTTAANVALSNGMVALFPSGTYTNDNVYTAGQACAGFQDLSGNGAFANDIDNAINPTFSTLATQPCAQFSGTQALQWPAFSMPLGAKTLMLVFQLTAAIPASTVWSAISAKNTTGNLFDEVLLCNLASYPNLAFYEDYQISINSIGSSPTLDTTAHALIETYNGSGNQVAANFAATYDNVAQSLSLMGSSPAGRTATDVGSIGGRVSSSGSVSVGAKIKIAEYAFWNRVLTASEQTQLAGYISGRYPGLV